VEIVGTCRVMTRRVGHSVSLTGETSVAMFIPNGDAPNVKLEAASSLSGCAC
jgi:hypothetical protein